jgi:hypothetical protein
MLCDSVFKTKKERSGYMMALLINKDNWPIVIFKFVGDNCDEDIKEYLDKCRDLIEVKVHHVVIADFLEYGDPDAKQRKMTADFLKQNYPGLRDYRVGLALALRSHLQRGAIKAIYWWVKNPPYSYKICKTFPEALEWAKEAAMAIAPGFTPHEQELPDSNDEFIA